MTILELAKVTGQFILLSLTALGLGLTVIDWAGLIARKSPTRWSLISQTGLAGLIGLGSLGYIWLSLGLLSQFTKINLELATLALAILVSKKLWWWVNELKSRLKQPWLVNLKSPLVLTLLLAIILILGGMYLAALQPPLASDELHYHFPEAETIANTYQVPKTIGQHYFYGNLPKLMEVIYAGAISMSGYSLAHTLHAAIFTAFIIFIIGFFSHHYRPVTGLTAALLIVLYDELTWNATVGFVDTATVSLEISALLMAINWLVNGSRNSLIISGLLIGLALSVKYSPIFTLVFIVLMIVINELVSKRFNLVNLAKTLLPFGGPAFVFGGYWYLKNLILFGNPSYPLYFGHKGVDELQYQGLIKAIQQFGPRTLTGFFHIPERFLTFNSLTIFFSFYLAPLALTIKKSFRLQLILIIYFTSYASYWYFLATHQQRFLMPAVIAALLSTAIFLTNLKPKMTMAVLTTVVVAAVLLNRAEHFYQNNSWWYFIHTKLRTAERGYALGRETKSQILNRTFGCQYAVVETLELKKLSGNVIDNWTIWHDPSVPFYTRLNRFGSYTFPVDDPNFKLVDSLRGEGLGYIYFNVETKKRFLANPDQEVINYRIGRDQAEDYLLARSSLVYENGQCRLYQIDFNRL